MILGTRLPSDHIKELGIVEVLNQGPTTFSGGMEVTGDGRRRRFRCWRGEKVMVDEARHGTGCATRCQRMRERCSTTPMICELSRTLLHRQAGNRPRSSREWNWGCRRRPCGWIGFCRQSILRHTVLRKRATLEDMGLLDRIAVDIWPSERASSMFGVWRCVGRSMWPMRPRRRPTRCGKRVKSAGFMQSMMQQRICSASPTELRSKRLLEKRQAITRRRG